MDEPLSNLDAQLRSDTRSQIVQLQKQLQVTTIYVTHDQVEAMTMGDRIVVLNKGDIQQVDTPLNIYRQPANQFVAGFMGSPPMNFLSVHIDAQGNLRSDSLTGAINLNDISLKEIGCDRNFTLGFRPEDLQPTTPQCSFCWHRRTCRSPRLRNNCFTQGQRYRNQSASIRRYWLRATLANWRSQFLAF
jgi:multiple sugar transport system ATP-binding protein